MRSEAKYDFGDRVRIEFPKHHMVDAEVVGGVYDDASGVWFYDIDDHDRPVFQCSEAEIIGKITDGSELQVVAKCLHSHKYSFAEYLREVCETAGGDCLQCKLMSLGYGYARVEPNGKHMKICEVLQCLLMNNKPSEVARFVADVVAFADEDDKKSED